ncbi:hypothetical protein F7734_13140 [Scytonema sp. UIC 10036]|uniref:hypothetical protein n=1 Tax=Scytonema sp. UIC 10036 TaxID=2304196 RepID=UPI0012DA4E74|nr:hypothetical protein [Scytonema sp. UIC 10036]MUG93320.1 hypothetical protein [Scytonema sp. UIC 10036]
MILASVYWRIPLNSDGQYQSAIRIAEIMAQFLEIPYFSAKSKARPQKIDLGMSYQS